MKEKDVFFFSESGRRRMLVGNLGPEREEA